MTIEEKRRELFEAWAIDAGLSTTKASQALMFANARRVPAGGYVLQETVATWAAFNAALDAVVIHLPPEVAPTSYNSPANSWNDALRKSLAAIESTGLGLKVLP